MLALSSNADNVGVGIAYGIRGIKVPFTSNLLIALVTGMGTLISMLLGQTVGFTMHPRLAGILGGAIILGIGCWVLICSAPSIGGFEGNDLLQTGALSNTGSRVFKGLFFVLHHPLTIDRDRSGHIDLKESWLLAIALSLNNVVNGVAAGMIGLNILLTTAAVMIFSMLTLWSGCAAGDRYGRRWLGNFASVVSGLLLVAIGAYEIATL
jgi:putative sporulation protein YtaF